MAEPESQSPQRQISRGVVAIYKDHLGRGPTRAQTTITEGSVLTLCEGSLTKAERQLAAQGDEELVRAIRRKFQVAMSEDIIALVESVTGRQSRSFLSDHDVTGDLAMEIVVLEDDPST